MRLDVSRFDIQGLLIQSQSVILILEQNNQDTVKKKKKKKSREIGELTNY